MDLWIYYSDMLCYLHIMPILKAVYGKASMPLKWLDLCNAFLESQLILCQYPILEFDKYKYCCSMLQRELIFLMVYHVAAGCIIFGIAMAGGVQESHPA